MNYYLAITLVILGTAMLAVFVGGSIWVLSIEAAGNVEIATYLTGATGLQAIISGVTGKAILCGERT